MRCLELCSSAFGAPRPSVWWSLSSASPGHLPVSAKSCLPSQRPARPAPDRERDGKQEGKPRAAVSLLLVLGKDPRSPFVAG